METDRATSLDVTLPPATPFRGKPKWVAVSANLAIAVAAAVFAVVIFAAVPADVVVMRVIAWGTTFAAACTAALAVAYALIRQLPTLRPGTLDDEDALVVRAWPGDWWHTQALDVAQLVMAAAVTTLGVAAGGPGPCSRCRSPRSGCGWRSGSVWISPAVGAARRCG